MLWWLFYPCSLNKNLVTPEKITNFMVMNLPHSPTYYTSLELYTQALREKGITAEITLELTASGEWARAGSGKRTTQIRQNLVVVEMGLLQGLGSNALRMAIHLMDDLKMNNALWYHMATNNYERSAIKELRDKGILFKTEDPHIHYVNPLCIRRGSGAGVLAQTTELLKGVSRVNKEIIRDLNFKSVKFNQFDQLNLPVNDTHRQSEGSADL